MIVKIQRPLEKFGISRPMVDPGDDATALVYNHDKSYLTDVQLSTVIELFKVDELKIYCKVKRRGDKLYIVKRVAAQNW